MFLSHVFAGETAIPNGYRYSYLKLHEAFANHGVTLTDEARNVLVHSVPGAPVSIRRGQAVSALTMWETDRLPDAIAQNLGQFRHLFVPSEHSASLMRPYHRSVHVVGLGIDPAVFWPKPKPRATGAPRILTFGHSKRKGIAELLRAWEMADMPSGSRLVIKSVTGGPKYDLPEGVEVIDATLTEDRLREVYHSADAYITCSYGEGWDLPAFQAVACGLPTVVPAHTAYLDWGHLAIGTLDRAAPAPAAMRIYGEAGRWLTPDVEEVAEALQALARNRRSLNADAHQASLEVRDEHTWDNVAARVLTAFDDLNETDEELGEAVPVVYRVWITATKSLEGYDVGPFAGSLEMGQRYEVPWEVARVLSEAGYVTIEVEHADAG